MFPEYLPQSIDAVCCFGLYAVRAGEFYKIRGWDVPSGLQKRAKLEELGLPDVAKTLKKEGLLR